MLFLLPRSVWLVSSSTGSGRVRTGSELGLFATAQNSGDILVRLKPRSERGRSSEEVIADLRPKLQEAAPLVEIEFVQLLQDMLGDLEGSPTPIEVKIFGDDPEMLETLAEPVEQMLEHVEGVVDVVGMQPGNPEVTWSIDPVAAGRIGSLAARVRHTCVPRRGRSRHARRVEGVFE